MKLRTTFFGLILTVLILAMMDVSHGAKYAGDPFHLGVGGRALGMGGANVSVADDVTAGFWNPAGLTNLEVRQVAFMHSETFGSLLNHDYAAFASRFGADGSSVGAVSFTRLGGGGIKLTEWDVNLNRAVVVKEAGHADYQLLISYAKRYTGKLAYGLSAKFLYRDIADNSAYGLGLDIGLRYDPNPSFSTGLMVRDATTTLLSYDTGTKESIYPTVVPSAAYRRAIGSISLIAVAEADVNFENYRNAAQYWNGSISADTHFGLELTYANSVFGRIGSDIGRLSFGGGVTISEFQIDIAYMRESDIDDSFRISLIYALK